MQKFQVSPNRALVPGDECSLKRLRGLYTFKYATVSDSGEISLTFVGGLPGHYQYKSVRPDRISTIHRRKQK